MKEHLINLAMREKVTRKRINVAREYLQARVLHLLQQNGAFTNWAFVGGTALRFLFDMPRYSEDLDFSAVDTVTTENFVELMQKVKGALARQTYSIDVKVRADGAVKSAYLKFIGLPCELDASPHTDENLSVKIEMDTNPPAGANVLTTTVRRHVFLNLLHYDKASLFSGKLHAILARPFTKGRDLYDLAWYLSDPNWPSPNFFLLNNALQQTRWQGPEMTGNNWREVISDKMRDIDWQNAIEDVSPFLESVEDVQYVDKDTIIQLLERGEKSNIMRNHN